VLDAIPVGLKPFGKTGLVAGRGVKTGFELTKTRLPLSSL
jgi:hypothetical protein